MPIPDAYDGTLALTLSRGLHVVAVSCQSWRFSLDRALGRCCCMCIGGWHAGRDMISHIQPEAFNSRTDVGLLAGALISGHRLCHLLRRVASLYRTAYSHTSRRVVCYLRHMHPSQPGQPGTIRGADLLRRHRVPIVIPTITPWHSRKQSFDGFPGDGATTIPELVYSTLSLSQSHHPA